MTPGCGRYYFTGSLLFYVTPGCGGFYSTASGTLTSPGYPDDYPHNTDCLWNIQVQRGRTVVLTFYDFDIEGHTNCTYDYVAVSILFNNLLFWGVFYVIDFIVTGRIM